MPGHAAHLDPYKHFYNLYPPKTDSEDEYEDIEVEWDENQNIVENTDNIKLHLAEQIEEAEKTRNMWLAEAMKEDPAFMVDPIKDYYRKLIPQQLLDTLNNEELDQIIAIYDPVTWGKLYLRKNHNGWRPRVSRSGIPYQAQMIRCKSKRMAGRAGRRIGKCEQDDSIVQTMRGPYTAKELFELKNRPDLLTMNQVTNAIYPTSNYTIEDNGFDETYKMTTRSGHVDTMTQEHPYYTIRNGMPEWVHIKDLQPGDRVAVLKKFPVISEVSLGREMSRLLGYLISDGSTSQDGQIGFTNMDSTTIDDISKVCEYFNCRVTPNGSLYGYRIAGIFKQDNSVINLVRQMDLVKLAIHKEIPRKIYISTKEDIINFISAAWDCDGWASIQNTTADSKHKTPAYEVGYCSSSEKLARGIKHLLLMLGIVSVVKKKKVKYNGEYRHAFQVTIHDEINFLKFYTQIPLLAKQKSLDAIHCLLQLKVSHGGKSYTTQTPRGIVNELERLRVLQGVDKNILRDNPNARYRTDSRLYSINKAKQYATQLNASNVLQIIDSDDFWWDEVEKVEYTGRLHSYAISVPETETFIANDTITHNTLSAVVRLLHKAYTFVETETQSTYNIVIFTPNQSQINTIFKMMEFLIDNNPQLMDMVTTVQGGKRIPTRKTPNYCLELENGCTITGYVSGSTAVRSSAANLLILDEASFLETEDTDAVIALLAENEDVELWVSSTPKGLKDYFYERVHDPNFVSFYFPTDKFHPNWSLKMMQEFKDQLTSSGYQHEVLADFSADGEGVFQLDFVAKCLVDYTYDTQKPEKECFYGLGIDWNDAANGTQIYVGSYNVVTKKFRVVAKESVNVANWTQLTAVKKVRELARKWRPVLVYADYGHGSTAIELLHEWGMKAPVHSSERILIKAKDINFSSMIEVHDPWSRKKVKKPAKAYLVNNAVRVVENNLIDISKYDTTLIKQMEGYKIERYTPSGVPVYAADKKVGDHALDAVMLMLLGFNLEYSSLGKPKLVESSGHVNIRVASSRSNGHTLSESDRRLQADKDYERQIYEDAHATVDRRTVFARRQRPTMARRTMNHTRRNNF